jgi:hypothetical protein
MRSALLALALLPSLAIHSAFAAETGPAVPELVDETRGSGLIHTFAGEWEFMVGGGAAAFDCDDDGYPDLLLAGGVNKAQLFRNASSHGGSLKFEPQESGLELDQVSGAYPLDVDGDGITDVVLLRVGETVVLRGSGECRFERANEAWAFTGGDAWWTSLAATWERGADWPTIALGSYIDRKEEISPWGSCTDNWLLRPAAGERKFGPPVALKPSFCPLSILFTDWNRSGTPSLRVSNDREYYEGGQEQMWKIEPGREPTLYTAEEGWKVLRIWGMGIAGYDLDFDGYPEYFLTSMADNKLQKLAEAPAGGEPRPSYADIAFQRGVTAHRPYVGDDVKPSTAWHTEFQDVNNDGLADIFVVKGNVWEMPDFAMLDPNNLLLQKPDGTFEEGGDRAGMASTKTGRGGAVTDFNLDGLVDIVVVNRNEPSEVWRNTGGDGIGNFVQVRIRQDEPNRDAIGAWMEVRCGDDIMRREVTIGGGHAGGQLGWFHFGVGDHQEAAIRIIWPDGTEGEWQTVSSNSFYLVAKGKPAERWAAAR